MKAGPAAPVLYLILLGGLVTACQSGPGTGEPAPASAITPDLPGALSAVETPSSIESVLEDGVAPLPTPLQFAFPTPGPNPVSAWRPPPYAVPRAARPEDHFFLLRPIPSGQVNWPHPRYRYGNTFFGEEAIHTGVDLDAARGTPVLAVGSGKVTWVGYGLYAGATQDDPYGLAVSILHDFGFNGQALLTVYAHLDRTQVWQGQHVEAGDQIGLVGDTGNAEGPHLHFEVRLGRQDGYFTTRNPELWMVPPEGWGVLAGLIRDSLGRPLPEQLVQLFSLDHGTRWDVWTYATQVVHSDDAYGENFVISDLPAGPYEVRINFAGHDYSAQMLVQPGQTNFLTFRGRSGFVVEPTPTPQAPLHPPTS